MLLRQVDYYRNFCLRLGLVFSIYDWHLVWLYGYRTAGEVLVHDLNGFLSDAAGYVDFYREFRLLRRVTFLSVAKEK